MTTRICSNGPAASPSPAPLPVHVLACAGRLLTPAARLRRRSLRGLADGFTAVPRPARRHWWWPVGTTTRRGASGIGAASAMSAGVFGPGLWDSGDSRAQSPAVAGHLARCPGRPALSLWRWLRERSRSHGCPSDRRPLQPLKPDVIQRRKRRGSPWASSSWASHAWFRADAARVTGIAPMTDRRRADPGPSLGAPPGLAHHD